MVVDYRGDPHVLVFWRGHNAILGLDKYYYDDVTHLRNEWVRVESLKHLTLLRIQHPEMRITLNTRNIIDSLKE